MEQQHQTTTTTWQRVRWASGESVQPLHDVVMLIVPSRLAIDLRRFVRRWSEATSQWRWTSRILTLCDVSGDGLLSHMAMYTAARFTGVCLSLRARCIVAAGTMKPVCSVCCSQLVMYSKAAAACTECRQPRTLSWPSTNTQLQISHQSYVDEIIIVFRKLSKVRSSQPRKRDENGKRSIWISYLVT